MQYATRRALRSTTGPLDGYQFSRLAQAIEGLTADQLKWVSGYLAGLVTPPRAEGRRTASEMTCLQLPTIPSAGTRAQPGTLW